MTVPDPTGTSEVGRLASFVGSASSSDEHAEVAATEPPMTATVPATPAVFITRRRVGSACEVGSASAGLFGVVVIGICSFSRVRTIRHAVRRHGLVGSSVQSQTVHRLQTPVRIESHRTDPWPIGSTGAVSRLGEG